MERAAVVEPNDSRSPNASLRLGGWLIIAWAIITSAVLHWVSGKWQLVFEPDSLSYIEFDWTTREGIFCGIRTPGYPLFLQMAQRSLGLDWVPVMHWCAMVAAVGLMMRGLRVMGFGWPSAIATALPLVWTRATWELGSAIASDSLAIALAIGSTGLFFAVLARPNSFPDWLGLGAMTLMTLLVRPAFLFLLCLWPLLAIWIPTFVNRAPWRTGLRMGALALLITTGPLLGYSALRWAMVGEFGLVSFAGFNWIGITGQYLTQDDIPKLSPEVRVLGERLIANRKNIQDYAPPDDYETTAFLFNRTVWVAAAPAAESLYGRDGATINRQLRRLAWESLRLHPAAYGRWLMHNGKRMWDQVVLGAMSEGSTRVVTLLTIFGLASLLIFHRWKHGVRGGQTNHSEPTEHRSAGQEMPARVQMHVVLWTIVAFVIGKGLLVTLVEPSLGRYAIAVGCLIPCMIGWTGYQMLRSTIDLLSSHHLLQSSACKVL